MVSAREKSKQGAWWRVTRGWADKEVAVHLGSKGAEQVPGRGNSRDQGLEVAQVGVLKQWEEGRCDEPGDLGLSWGGAVWARPFRAL